MVEIPNNAVMISVQSLAELTEIIHQVRATVTSQMSNRDQAKALIAIADALQQRQDDILEANTLDLETSLEMAVPGLVVDWLKLTPERLQNAINILRRLSVLDLPQSPGIDAGFVSPDMTTGTRFWQPLGVVALIYEALPELAMIAVGLCIRTGNGLLLKGGTEASQTCQIIAEAVRTGLGRSPIPEHRVYFLSPSEGESARRWLMQTPDLDLIIPYGRASLVQQVTREASSPVVPTVIGNCYVYWASSGSVDTVAHVVIDSHQGIPEAVNSVEKILIDNGVSDGAAAELFQRLRAAGFTLKGDVETGAVSNVSSLPEEEWRQANLRRTLRVRRVLDCKTAIALINSYSNGHADCIVTESYAESRQFIQTIHSASVYINRSPRFMRNSPEASAIALGMSPQRGRFAGRLGLDMLRSIKTIVEPIVP